MLVLYNLNSPLACRAAAPAKAVNFYGRVDDKVAQFISFLEKCVEANRVHQGSEENEEFCPAPSPASGREFGAGRAQGFCYRHWR
jgi:hypothetical protein